MCKAAVASIIKRCRCWSCDRWLCTFVHCCGLYRINTFFALCSCSCKNPSTDTMDLYTVLSQCWANMLRINSGHGIIMLYILDQYTFTQAVLNRRSSTRVVLRCPVQVVDCSYYYRNYFDILFSMSLLYVSLVFIRQRL